MYGFYVLISGLCLHVGKSIIAFSRATSWKNLDLYAFEENQIQIDQEVITENQRLWSLFVQRFPQ